MQVSSYSKQEPLNFAAKLREWDDERWGETCRLMQVCLMQGSRRRAVEALDTFAAAKKLVRLSLDSHLAELEFFGVDSITLCILDDAGFSTVRSVAMAKDYELMRLPNMGETRVGQLREGIKKAGC